MTIAAFFSLLKTFLVKDSAKRHFTLKRHTSWEAALSYFELQHHKEKKFAKVTNRHVERGGLPVLKRTMQLSFQDKN